MSMQVRLSESNKTMKNTNCSAFTLIELLVVTMIMGIVAAAVAACLAGGMRAWESVQRFNSLELNILPPLQSLEKEVKNSIVFYDIDFSGGEDWILFPALIPQRQDEVISYKIGTVSYKYDPLRQKMIRKAWVYPDEEPDESERIMSGINDVRFEYFYTEEGKEGGSGEWDDFRTDGTNRLSAVRLTLEGMDEKKITRTIVMPYSRTRGKAEGSEAKLRDES